MEFMNKLVAILLLSLIIVELVKGAVLIWILVRFW